jgi:chromosome partitioning protein
MSVIAYASIKGGVGKTTSLVCLADHIAAAGDRCHVIDADPNGHASRMTLRMAAKTASELLSAEAVDETSIRHRIRAARADIGLAGLVLVDLPGVAAKTTLFGLGLSDLVIVPVGPSGLDVSDAVRTVELVSEAADFVGRSIGVRLLPSRWPIQIETRIAREARRRLEKQMPRTPLIGVPLMQRVQLAEMTMSYEPPRIADPDGNAAGNVRAVCDAILGALDEHRVAA